MPLKYVMQLALSLFRSLVDGDSMRLKRSPGLLDQIHYILVVGSAYQEYNYTIRDFYWLYLCQI